MTSRNWQEVALSEVCSLITDGTHHSPPNGGSGDFKYITAKNIKASGLDLRDLTYVSADVHDEIYRRCPPEKGDVLYIKDGVTTGIATINTLDEPFSMLSSVALLKPLREALSPSFLSHWLNSPSTFTAMTGSMTGSAIRRLVLRQIRETRLLLPPLPEQHRIVAKIDSLFARSSRARQELAHIPKLIERYRQAVLEAAFRGDLTADWRGDKALGVPPQSWRQVEALDLFDEGPTNGYSPKAAADGRGTKSLKLSATTTGNFILNEQTTKRLVEDVSPNARCWLLPGDVLIQRANSLEYVGATAVFDGPEGQYVYPDLMMRVRIGSPITRQFFWRYMNSIVAREWLRERATGTAGNMPKISGAILKILPVPVPPEDEQAEIVRRIDRHFAAIAITHNELQRAVKDIDRLDQSILDKAFTGKLVPQDPADEPASKLLERIQAARAATPMVKRGRKAKGAA